MGAATPTRGRAARARRVDVADAVELVRPVVEDVRDRGAEAVREATQRFDGVALDRPAGAGRGAARRRSPALDPAVRAALEEAARRARTVAPRSCAPTRSSQVVDGATVTERWVPVGRVGLYVPGGRVAYPSSVVMNVVPAQVAGVRSLAVASPPQADGLPHPVVLAACALLGVDEVYAVGGAQAIAMLAYGAEAGCAARVDVITGPGNVYVAAAKRLVQGRCAIDSEAGPTEIGILADATAVAGARRRRPRRAGRARPAGGLPARHRQRRAARRGRRRAGHAGRGHQAPRAGRDGASPTRARTCSSTTSTTAWRCSTPGRPSTSR